VSKTSNSDGGGGAVTSLAFLVGGLVALGTASGGIVLVGEGGVKSRLQLSGGRTGRRGGASATGSSRSSSSGGVSTAGGASQAAAVPASTLAVQLMVTRGRGLLVACTDGAVYLLEPPEGAQARSSSGGTGETLRQAKRWVFGVSGTPVSALSVSATDDQLALAAGEGKLLFLDLNNASKEDNGGAAGSGDDGSPADDNSRAGDGSRSSTSGGTGASRGGKSGAAAHQQRVSARASLSGDGAAATVGIFGSTSADEDRQQQGPFKLWLGGPCIGGRVAALAATSHQPLLMAVAPEERGVRLWDWARRRCLVVRRLWDEPLCCALHPSGLLALVGTTEKLLVFHVMRVSGHCGSSADM